MSGGVEARSAIFSQRKETVQSTEVGKHVLFQELASVGARETVETKEETQLGFVGSSPGAGSVCRIIGQD